MVSLLINRKVRQKKINEREDMVVHTFNPNNQEAETDSSPGQLGLHRDSLS